MKLGHVLVPSQRMANQDSVAFCRVQCAVGPISHDQRCDRLAAVKRQAIRENDPLVIDHGQRGDGRGHTVMTAPEKQK